MSREIGVGLVGYGGIGRVHALCYRMLPLCYPDLPLRPRIAAVLVASPQGAERARRELGDLHVTTNLEELLADTAVELVDCCAPTGEHAAILAAALDAGRPVFCEKPLAVDPAEGALLASVAAARGLVCGVNYHFRCIPALQEAQRWIEGGGMGDIVSFQMRYYRASNLKRDRPLNWRFQGAGSGVLVDLGAHLVDLVAHLLGPISSVAARTRTLVEQRPGPNGQLAAVESDDAAWMSLELQGGGVGTAHVSKVTPGAADDLRIEAYGTRGALVFDTADPNGLVLADSQGQRRLTTFSRATPAPLYPSGELATAPLLWHMTSIGAYLEALNGGSASTPSFADAARVDAVLAAALRSAGAGG
ncbi:MAG: Gfo/Idh/MocA family oxidoreductase, partial [Roseiflexaceae bacterium]|nr:Gfo/Idh/MocA family oxidoreductase [Roseiflexaceae bacterium]